MEYKIGIKAKHTHQDHLNKTQQFIRTHMQALVCCLLDKVKDFKFIFPAAAQTRRRQVLGKSSTTASIKATFTAMSHVATLQMLQQKR